MLGFALACGVECGPRTVERDGVCVGVGSPIVVVDQGPGALCGPGTVDQDGVCVVAPPIPTCGVGTILRGDVCVPLATVEVEVPFAAGVVVTVSQGEHGGFSHSGASEYAIDFPADPGTTVVAAHAGRVVELKEDSDYGCPDPSCSSSANFVTVDHGDGTFGQYWHLEQDGALVEVGDLVARGQAIGLSGQTGWASGPHVHLQVRDPLGQSLPMSFVDQPDGIVYAGGTFVSGNEEQAPPTDLAWSTCPVDLLSWLGVRLDPGTPCSTVDPDTDYPIGGEILVDQAQVVTGIYSVQSDLWTYHCTAAPNGRFDGTVRWSSDEYRVRTWLAVSPAHPDECTTYQSWNTSIYLMLSGYTGSGPW